MDPAGSCRTSLTWVVTTKRRNQFLQFDSGPGNDRIIIFSSLEQLQLLENCEQLLVDGTSKVSIFFSWFYNLT